MQLTGRDVHALVGALAPAVGGKIQKVYGTERFALVLDLYARDLSYRYLYVELPSLIFAHTVKVEMPVKPPGFAARIRSQLQGMRITGIGQYERDRIVRIELEGTKRMTLLIELFAKGNIIVLDGEGVIRNLLVKESYGSRDVRPGALYAYPPTSSLDLSDLEGSLDPDKHLVAQVAAAGFGGPVAESILSPFVLSVASARLSDLGDRAGLERALIEEWEASRFVISGDRIVTDAQGGSILDLLASHIDLAPAPEEERPVVHAKSERAIDIQRQRADTLAQRRAEDLRRGELLFEHYPIVEEALAFARSYRAEHGSLEGLESVWPERFPPLVGAKGIAITIDFERFK